MDSITNITLNINPSFLPACRLSIDLTSNNRMLSFNVTHRDAVEKCHKWATNINHEHQNAIQKIASLAQKIVELKIVDYKITATLDGVGLECLITKNGEVDRYSFSNPKIDSDELQLVIGFINLTQKVMKYQQLVNYIELLEDHFPIKGNVKVLKTDPYTIKLYGNISANNKKSIVLEKEIDAAGERGELIIDLTNFSGMGTAHFKCFAKLYAIKDLKILVTHEVAGYLQHCGFYTYLANIGLNMNCIAITDEPAW